MSSSTSSPYLFHPRLLERILTSSSSSSSSLVLVVAESFQFPSLCRSFIPHKTSHLLLPCCCCLYHLVDIYTVACTNPCNILLAFSLVRSFVLVVFFSAVLGRFLFGLPRSRALALGPRHHHLEASLRYHPQIQRKLVISRRCCYGWYLQVDFDPPPELATRGDLQDPIRPGGEFQRTRTSSTPAPPAALGAAEEGVSRISSEVS